MKSPLVRARDGRNKCSVGHLLAHLLAEVDQELQLTEECASRERYDHWLTVHGSLEGFRKLIGDIPFFKIQERSR